MILVEQDGRFVIEPELRDTEDIELEELRLEKKKREETDRKLSILAEELGITF